MVTKMSERLVDDRRSLTLTLAQGVGIGMGGDRVYRSWLAQQAPQAAGPGQDAVARQRATIQRLQTLFAHQPSAALRGVIEVKPD